ncbi:MAG TPA: hypothetical protein VHE32_10230 [Rhodanobacteraceae bacterium]|nr:hypothetical protein [Rhodanobacteraceae bacterium]
MDIYLPDEFYALSETPNPRRTKIAAASDTADTSWFGADAFAEVPFDAGSGDPRFAPDPLWQVI